jgi:hypothetical protein
MDFIDQLKTLSSKIAKQLDIVQTEEATKNAFIMPFISALGYNVFDPQEVTPEFTADVGTKKGEKVDYAIFKDGHPIILFECKWSGVNLDNEHASQLYRYFSVTKARFGVLTNGVVYRFFTDTEESNKMDSKPFLEFNMLDLKDSLVDDIKRFCKQSFDLDNSLAAATDLKYTKEIKSILAEQLNTPSEEFVKFFASQIYSGRLTKTVYQQFSALTKKAVNQFINDRINDRLKSALTEEKRSEENPVEKEESEEIKEPVIKEPASEVLEAFYLIKSVLRDVVDIKLVTVRVSQNYCSVLFDNNRRKPICRLYFNDLDKKQVAFLDEKKQEEKLSIGELDEIYQFADRLKLAVSRYVVV